MNQLKDIAANYKASLSGAKIKNLIYFLVVFVLIKGLVFLTPILISNLITDTGVFGHFEYEIGTGQLLASFFSLGMSGVYPYYVLTLQKTNFRRPFFAHGLLLTALSVTVAALYYLNVIGLQFLTIVIIGSCFAQQVTLSFIYKTHSKTFKAVVLDGGIYIAILTTTIVFLVSGRENRDVIVDKVWLGGLIYSLGMGVVYLREFLRSARSENPFKAYFRIAGRGAIMVVAGLLMGLLTTSTRIYLEHFLDYQAVGIFGFYFRVATSVVMIQQVINIVFFKKIFQADMIKLDRYLSVYLSIVLSISLAIYLIFPIVGKGWFHILDATFKQYKIIFFIVSIQMNFWICLSILENSINRFNLLVQSIIIILVSVVAFLSALFLLHTHGLLSFRLLVGLNAVTMFVAIELECLLLKTKAQAALSRTRFMNYLILLIGVFGYFLI